MGLDMGQRGCHWNPRPGQRSLSTLRIVSKLEFPTQVGEAAMETRVRQEGQWNPGADPNGWRGWRESREESRQAHECVPWNVERTSCSFQTPCAMGEPTRTAMSLARPASHPLWVCPLVLCGRKPIVLDTAAGMPVPNIRGTAKLSLQCSSRALPVRSTVDGEPQDGTGNPKTHGYNYNTVACPVTLVPCPCKR